MANFTILIIDDEPSNIEIFVECLKRECYTILVALSGADGYQIALQKIPDLIITDWDMPNMSGLETISLLKQHQLTKSIPIIMATGKMLQSEDLKTALEAGANDYIRKPIDKIELIARINSMILLVATMKRNFELERQIIFEREQALLQVYKNNLKELTTKTLKLIKNGEFNDNLLEKLTNLENTFSKGDSATITELINEFKTHNYTFNFEALEHTFNQVHTEFYGKLQKEFPMLSGTDRKMCAFLKLNLSSKDIAALTFDSLETIKKQRFRLRKKLNLDSEASLSSFMQNY